MPDVRITHTTRYTYARPVGLLTHRLMLRPQDSHDLRLHEATIDIDPLPASSRWAHDVFGNSVCLLDWAPGLRTDHLRIVSRLRLTHYPPGVAQPRNTLDTAAEFYPFAYPPEEMPDLGALALPQQPDPAGAVAAWARGFLGHGSAIRTLPLLEAMTRAIKDQFAYRGREEEGTQAASQTLALGTGTCRDFALLMMEAARSLGLAARFVSGYLYSASGQAQQGAGATHAWCGIYLPGAGWVEFDPTNGLVSGSNLIRVGVTRTPEQAVPVGGGFVGDPTDPLGMAVEVLAEVTG
jgi:transglutaminase-like putative cysteine protease